MENDMMIAVLNELLAEQKDANQKMATMEKAIAIFRESNEKLERKLSNLDIKIPPVDLRPTEMLLIKNIEEIKKVIAEQPKNITQEKRYLFFPEHKTTEYYDAIFRGMVRNLIATYSFFVLLYLIQQCFHR